MSQENVEAVRAVYEQFARGDFSGFADRSDEFEFVTSPEVPDGGTYRGPEARRWMKTWVESFEFLTMEATDFIDAGDRVCFAILQRGRARGSEAVMEGRWWQVVTFRGDEIARAENFTVRADALDAAGLTE